MRLNSALLTTLMLLAATPFHAQAGCPLNIQGETIFWVVSLCQLRAETDDFESPAVQACIEKVPSRHKLASSHSCKLNASYKREWCSLLVKNGVERSAEECFNSRETIPTVVRNGHVGN